MYFYNNDFVNVTFDPLTDLIVNNHILMNEVFSIVSKIVVVKLTSGLKTYFIEICSPCELISLKFVPHVNIYMEIYC